MEIFRRFALCAAIAAYFLCGHRAYSNDFLNFPVGAKASALGEAYEANSFDATASRWNPAGICMINGKQLYMMHTSLWEDTSYSFFGYSGLWGETHFGTSLYSMESGGFVKMDSIFDDPQTFSIRNNALFMTLGSRVRKDFATGVNLKFLKETIYNTSSTGYGADIGMLYTGKINAGWKITNVVSPYLNRRYSGEKMPMVYSFAASIPGRGFLTLPIPDRL